MTIHTILEEFRQTATSERDKGDKFERLILQYLQTDPIYQEHFSQVWLWMDFPLRNHAPDTGIDLVAQETDTGNYCAIQCKFYDRTYTLEKKDIDSFFTASGTKLFSKRIIISTTDKWSKHAEEALKNQQIPVTRITLYDLENSPIDWSQFSLNYGKSNTSKSAYKVKDITGKYHIKNQLKLKIKKQLRHHQQKALEAVMDGFKEADRGKLIMACGTGKTFTSLKIAEQFAGDNSLVLFLVPSISLLSQTLREWTTESDLKFHSIAVCSDSNVGKRKRKNDDDTADITVNDLPFPPTTNAQEIINSYRAFYPPLTPPLKGGESDSSLSKGDLGGSKLTVIFSTYQSIGAIADAQKKGLPEFDLIICDEAHRTTGVTIAGEDESYFVKVHDNEFIKGKKRLYMTATPKIYEDSVKVQAQENDALLCSMDNVEIYGREFHRLGFGEAVANGLLTDYKVMVLAVDEKYVSATFQRQLADADNELNLEDAVKITGCWNGLAKKFMENDGQDASFTEDKTPMKRAVAFSRSIKDSQRIVDLFTQIIEQYKKINPDEENILDCQLDHVDGTQNSLERTAKLEWLKADPPQPPLTKGGEDKKVPLRKGEENKKVPLTKGGEDKKIPFTKGEEDKKIPFTKGEEDKKIPFTKGEEDKKVPFTKGDLGGYPSYHVCRILSNARCLSEGVDVPALDAVMFLTPRNSVVDVVQSVGRVMRKAEGKKYGYIILPVGIPADMSPEVALKDNNKYKVIWQVLQALRAHDDRFNATINKIELNQKRPPQINFIGVGGGVDDKGDRTPPLVRGVGGDQLQLNFPIEEWRDAIYAKIVLKCGNRRYWEDWAKDVAKIADNHISRIKGLLTNSQSEAKQIFDEFLQGLRQNLNPNVTEEEAIEMLSQHLITKPVFDALFEGYEFTKYNPVSQTMQKMLDVLEGQSLEKEVKTLEKFYQSVRQRASGIDNAEGKQRIIIELYDKFFRSAFPRLVERLGIVYTPVEVVDFIIKSADVALKQEFGVSLSDEGVHILDPFTGTGTFMVRLLQSGLIKPEDLQRKFTSELHANEIVLLAYYIACINIEETFHYLSQPLTPILGNEEYSQPLTPILGNEEYPQPLSSILGNEEYSQPLTPILGNEKNPQPLTPILGNEEYPQPLTPILGNEEYPQPLTPILGNEEYPQPLTPILGNEEYPQPLTPILGNEEYPQPLTPILGNEEYSQPLTPILGNEEYSQPLSSILENEKTPQSWGAGGAYTPFNGIVLTDTFQMYENDGYLMEKIFPENNQRVINQKSKKITVIIGNPPYSAGQKSENDGNKNLKYDKLDDRIRNTYAEYSTATNKNSLYGSEIRGVRWASDRIKDKGIVCYVINGALIDDNSKDGLRKCLVDEFTSIYCFNLRGNQRTSGEQSRKEGGKIFGSGSRATIAIIFLIKNPDKKPLKQVNYYDIGDYLSREEKLNIIQKFGDISAINWEKITPNDNHDWINQRNDIFESFISLGDKKDKASKTIFDVYSSGVKTNRDAWCYNFSRQSVIDNMSRMIDFYNSQVEDFKDYLKSKKITNVKERQKQVDSFINIDEKKISWTRELKEDLGRFNNRYFTNESLVKAVYRPYCKQAMYFNQYLNNCVYQMPKIFPNQELENLTICVIGIGETKEFSALITDVIPNLHLIAGSQCFPLYTYEKQEDLGTLFTTINSGEYVKKENISDVILTDFKKIYQDKTITKEDIFYYVYGVLHSPEYKERFASDLKKMLPRIPYGEDFWAFSKAGKDLAYWHLNYEEIEPYPVEEIKKDLFLENKDYQVEKMVFAKNKKEVDKTTIIYNSKITLSQIPLETYEYIVNGKSALEWVMERYKITKDKDSGIVNNPNDWSEDDRYIIDLVKRVIRVSLESVKIVKKLPALKEKNSL